MANIYHNKVLPINSSVRLEICTHGFCHPQGDTIEAAIENIKDAIKGCISSLDKETNIQAKQLGVMERRR